MTNNANNEKKAWIDAFFLVLHLKLVYIMGYENWNDIIDQNEKYEWKRVRKTWNSCI